MAGMDRARRPPPQSLAECLPRGVNEGARVDAARALERLNKH